jgi:hypothetical protein
LALTVAKFRQIADFQFCGLPYAGVNGDSIWILAQAYVAEEPARRLRDWLNAVLPDDPGVKS